MTGKNEYFWLFLIITVGVVLRLMWATLMPIGDPPDEIWRIKIPAFIYQHDRSPIAGQDLSDPYILRPILGYWLASYYSKISPIPVNYTYSLRFFNVAISGIFLGLIYLLVKQLWPQNSLAPLALTAWFAAWPSIIELGSYVNLEAIGLLASVGLMLTTIRLSQKVDLINFVFYLAAAELVFFSKITAWPTLIASIIFLIYHYRKEVTVIYNILLVQLLFLIGPILFYWHNWVVYKNLALPFISNLQNLPAIGLPEYFTYTQFSLWNLIDWVNLFFGTIITWWGSFNGNYATWPDFYITIFVLLVFVAGYGLIKKNKYLNIEKYLGLTLALSLILYVYFNWHYGLVAHFRYLLAGIVPLTIFFYQGCEVVMGRIKASQIWPTVVWSFFILLVGSNFIMLFSYLYPAYFIQNLRMPIL